MPHPTRAMPISTRPCRATSAVAGPTCASARPSSVPPPRVKAVSDTIGSLTRRDFFSVAAAAGFVLGFRVPTSGAADTGNPTPFAPNAFIRIDEAGLVTLVIPQVEMGQGTYTSLSQILAEELDADWSKVRVEHAPPNLKLYMNPGLGDQATGNSNSIRAFWQPMRKAGATARACLIEAAAR